MYDAFISYRHTELDKFVAENLHRQMEAFKLPGNVSKKTGRTRIERVFRDRDELPLASNLADPITEALAKSEYLIVICSPRLRQSQWCQKEIDTFIRMHGREKVFAVLIEGEPEESFPLQLLYVEEEVREPDGTIRTVKRPVEPLAADVRGKNNREVLKAMKTELLRLLAPMFELSYDDLRQRHRERRMRKIMAASLGVAAVCLAFGAVSTTMALRIKSQKEQIQAQNQEIIARNQEITEQNMEIQNQTLEIQNKNEILALQQALSLAQEADTLLAAGDRVGAVEKAYSALTQQAGVEMPYTAQAQYSLTEALYAYSSGTSFQPVHQLRTAGAIDHLVLSPDGEYALCNDSSEVLYLFHIPSGELIQTFQELGLSGTEESYSFLDEDRVIMRSERGRAEVYTISTDSLSAVTTLDRADSFRRSSDGEHLWVVAPGSILLLDIDTMAVELELPVEKQGYGAKVLGDSREGKCMAYKVLSGDETVLHLVDYGDGEIREKIYTYPGEHLEKGVFWGGCFYVYRNYSDIPAGEYATYVTCFEEDTLTRKWECGIQDTLGCFVRPATCENGRYLLCGTSAEVSLIDQNTGELYCRFSLGSQPIESLGYTTSDLYAVFTRDGNMYTIAPQQKMCYASGLYTGFSSNMKYTKNCKNGLAVVPYNSNCVTIYQMCNQENLTPYEGELPVNNGEETLQYTQARTYGEELGLENPSWIRSIVFGEEGLLFIGYRDNTTVVYDRNAGKVVGRFTSAGVGIDCYFGRDKNGNYYVGGYGDGFVLDPSFQCIARVDSMAGLLADQSQVLVKGGHGEYFTLNIYSIEDLLAMAEEIVVR